MSDIDLVDDVEDDWQRRQYLQQIYESHRRARQELTQLSLPDSRGSRETLTAALCDAIRLCEPMLRGRELWANTPMGQVPSPEDEEDERMIAGLRGILIHEDGVEQNEIEGTHPRLSTPNTNTVEKQPLPLPVLRKGFRELTEFLYQQDILVAKTGEAEAKATDPL